MLDVGHLMRGGCMIFALHLHKRSRLPLFGLMDENGRIHHAGVGEAGAELLFDGRGKSYRDDFAYWRGQPCAGDRLEAVTAAEIKAVLNEERLPIYSRQAMDAYMQRNSSLFAQMPILPEPERPRPAAKPKQILGLMTRAR